MIQSKYNTVGELCPHCNHLEVKCTLGEVGELCLSLCDLFMIGICHHNQVMHLHFTYSEFSYLGGI